MQKGKIAKGYYSLQDKERVLSSLVDPVEHKSSGGFAQIKKKNAIVPYCARTTAIARYGRLDTFAKLRLIDKDECISYRENHDIFEFIDDNEECDSISIRAKRRAKYIQKITSSPEAAKKCLIEAGILDEDGNLSEIYK